MHFYYLATTFTFGIHQGQTVEQVVAEHPGYLNFCVQVLDHFALRRADVEAWQEQFPKLRHQLTDAAWAKIDEKETVLNAHDEDEYNDRDDFDYSYSARDAERDTFDALTDGQYGDYDDWGGNMDHLRDAMGY
ncbi:MAG: hypothetical protein M3Y54_05275 [Bacteroidota bacterium]|nr:hypothetical protein [Bacteroidota bacterium]